MSLPTGYSPPAYVISADDHGGVAAVTSGVGLVIAVLFILVRLFMRSPLRIGLFNDDWIIIVGTVRIVRRLRLIQDRSAHSSQTGLRPHTCCLSAHCCEPRIWKIKVTAERAAD